MNEILIASRLFCWKEKRFNDLRNSETTAIRIDNRRAENPDLNAH